MRLNKITNHAIRILGACGHAGDDLRTAADIAVELDLTQQNTVKIIHVLICAGFLKSTRGRNGGVRLAVPADEIYIGAVVREIESGLGDAALDGVKPSNGFDVLIEDAFAAFLEVLDRQTLADLVNASHKPKAKRQTQTIPKTDHVQHLKKRRKPSLPRTSGSRS